MTVRVAWSARRSFWNVRSLAHVLLVMSTKKKQGLPPYMFLRGFPCEVNVFPQGDAVTGRREPYFEPEMKFERHSHTLRVTRR